MDTISAGGVIQWAMETYERGLVPEEYTGKLDLHFGSEQAATELPWMIAYREGIGDLLAYGATPERCARLFTALTGMPMEADQIMQAGRRILTLERLISLKLGWREDPSSYAPWRLMNERQESLDMDDPILDVEKMRSMVKEYYALHGWDKETGVPTKAIIEELELSDFV